MRGRKATGDGRTTTVRRLKVVPHDKVRPFLAKMPAPIPGESLLGFVTRCLEHTAVRQTVQGLTLAGIGKLQPFALATTLNDGRQIRSLATLLQTTTEEIVARLHRLGTLPNGRSVAVDFFGVMIRADYREKKIRRVSPRALDLSLHHRAVWDLRVFSFDPQTKETLLDTCPVCQHTLGWRRARGIQMCDRCVSPDQRANVDLRDFPQPLVEVEDEEALDFVTALVDIDPARRAAARRTAPAPWSSLSESDLFETVVAFACALTMKPDAARTTLDRPKDVREYARFRPEILAASGRAIIGGNAGFAAVADRIRADAPLRPGHYGVKKELLPLFCMTVDQHLSRDIKKILKKTVRADMERTKAAMPLRRADYAGDGRYLSIDALADETGLPKKALGRLADRQAVPVIRAADAELSPVLMPIAAVLPLVLQYRDAVHEKFAAGTLSIKPHVLPDLVKRGLIEQIQGPVLALFETWAPYFRKSSVEALATSIWDRAREGGPAPDGGMRISKAVKRLGMTPVPWGAVIAAIVNGGAEICTHPGENKNWLTGIAARDVRAFVRAVRAELREGDNSSADEWISNSVAAELLGVNESFFWCILKDRRRIPKEDRIRRQYPGVPSYSRANVESFARKYIFVPEIQRRARLPRARDVRTWLEERGVDTEFRLEEERNFGYLRARVEPVLAKEEKTSRIAAE